MAFLFAGFSSVLVNQKWACSDIIGKRRWIYVILYRSVIWSGNIFIFVHFDSSMKDNTIAVNYNLYW